MIGTAQILPKTAQILPILCAPMRAYSHVLIGKLWRPHGDSNPGYRRERAMS